MFYKNIYIYALCLILAPQIAYAQEENKQYFSLSIENDNLGGGTDKFYTSGIRATWFDTDINIPPIMNLIADKIPTFDLNDKTSTFYTIGHNIYTPENITLIQQPQNDRPWAAFLYGSIGLATITYNDNAPFHVDELEMTIGLVGPEALGEQAQKFVHKNISNSPIPRGWDNQLDFEPGIILSWQRRIPYAWEKDVRQIHTRIEPNFAVSLGNIHSNIGAGATFIIASDKGLDTPPRVRPSIPGTGVFITEDNILNWQIFAGLDGRLVGRNIFLDGNSFSNSYSVDKEYLVGDLSAGLSLFYDDFRLSYTLNLRTKEFEQQNGNSIFGSLTLTKRF